MSMALDVFVNFPNANNILGLTYPPLPLEKEGLAGQGRFFAADCAHSISIMARTPRQRQGVETHKSSTMKAAREPIGKKNASNTTQRYILAMVAEGKKDGDPGSGGQGYPSLERRTGGLSEHDSWLLPSAFDTLIASEDISTRVC
jgi:hypothetical protein